MRTEIRTRNYGTIVFRCSDAGGYVYATLLLERGQPWRQICERGNLTGPTLLYYGTHDNFDAFCRRWWRTFLRNQRSL
jgi:hypothetical protein